MSLVLIINFLIAILLFRIIESFFYDVLKDKNKPKKKSFREELQKKIEEEKKKNNNLDIDKNT